MPEEKKWSDLSPDEKREIRFNRWLIPEGISFSSPEAEQNYKTRVTRIIKTIKLEEPDRVPVLPVYWPSFYDGSNLKKIMYDYEELKRVWFKFLNDFEEDLDMFIPPGLVFPGKILDLIDYKIHFWPGKGIPDDNPSIQFIEGEYMKPEEYDSFINDPTGYLFRTYLPRIAGAFKGFQKLTPLTPFIGIPTSYIAQYGHPEIKASLQAFMDAVDEAVKWGAAVMEVGMTATQNGLPNIFGSMCGAPFDLLGDMMRGTRGIMMDMYQRPEKLIKAMERIVPIILEEAIGLANASGCPLVFMPLHKGTGGFMSDEQFRRFYWPTFKEVMMLLINEGLVPMPFAEGDYTPRLEVVKDLPRASVIWWFETVDMVKAKKIIGNNNCITGSLPISVLCTGTPDKIKEDCRKLIEICVKGSGFILTGSTIMDKGDPENYRAMVNAAKEYGTYS